MPKVKLSQGEIQEFSDDIAKILNRIPLFYVYECLELANEDRQRDGDLSDLDVSDSEDEDEVPDDPTTSEDEDEDDEDDE